MKLKCILFSIVSFKSFLLFLWDAVVFLFPNNCFTIAVYGRYYSCTIKCSFVIFIHETHFLFNIYHHRDSYYIVNSYALVIINAKESKEIF